MELNDRLLEFSNWYTNKQDITRKELSDRLSVSPSQLSSILNGRDKAGLLIVEKYLNLHPDLNANWLLTGEGSMTNKDHVEVKPKVSEIETRPRIPMNAAAGSVSIALNGVSDNDCEAIPIISAFSKYSYTILVKGDSMEPEFHSGDELACLQIMGSSFIQWGRCHVLDTAQGVIVKRIYDKGDFILCKSECTDLYKDFEIQKDDIYNISLVVGMLRRY